MIRPKILVVDDAETLRDALCASLHCAGFDVIDAADGRGAVDAAQKHHPDVILMDLMMPGMDGWGALSVLRADPATTAIPVIACTASDPDAAEVLRAGFAGCLRKPMRVPALVEAISAHLRGSPAWALAAL